MKQKYFFRGLGLGILFTTLVFMYIRSTENVTETEVAAVLKYAEAQGYLQTADIQNDLHSQINSLMEEYKAKLDTEFYPVIPTPSPIPSNTPTPSPTVTPTVTLTNTPAPTFTPTPKPTNTPVPTPAKKTEAELAEILKKYTFTDFNKPVRIYISEGINVRNLPTSSGDKLGTFKKHHEIWATGRCNENGWYRVIYNNTIAYISDKYVVDAPPKE